MFDFFDKMRNENKNFFHIYMYIFIFRLIEIIKRQ